MISSSVFFAFILASVFTLIVPVAILVFLGVKKKIAGLPLLVGALAFFISQIVLRLPLMSVLSGQLWYRAFAANLIPYVLVLSLSAGLFEESARLGGALLLKKHRSFKDVLSFGLGHAFCEVILLVGFTHISNIVLCVIANGANGALAATLPAGILETAAAQLAAVAPAHIYLGIVERFSATLLHLFATVLVFKGVLEKKWYFYALAVAAHTLFNFIGVILTNFAGVVVAEAALLAMALAAGYYILRARRTW